jgi:hypothetical protein
MNVSWTELFQFLSLIVVVIHLVIDIDKKK